MGGNFTRGLAVKPIEISPIAEVVDPQPATRLEHAAELAENPRGLREVREHVEAKDVIEPAVGAQDGQGGFPRQMNLPGESALTSHMQHLP